MQPGGGDQAKDGKSCCKHICKHYLVCGLWVNDCVPYIAVLAPQPCGADVAATAAAAAACDTCPLTSLRLSRSLECLEKNAL